ncbi:hypothetical protein OT109_04770 [Phycisphaeraceae bacterium D3-23]
MTSDNSSFFYQALRGVSEAYLSKLPYQYRFPEHKVHNLIAVIRQDRTCEVAINQWDGIAECRTKRSVEKGEPISEDDLLGVESLSKIDIEVPDDSGVLFVHTYSWRRALYFDYGPWVPGVESSPRPAVSKLMGAATTLLMFQDRTNCSDSQWNEFFNQGWFPFITLQNRTVSKMQSYSAEKWPIDELLDEVRSDLLPRLPAIKVKARNSDIASGHAELICRAIDHYLNGDDLSAVAIMYPRLEGILRSCAAGSKNNKNSQASLSRAPGLLSEAAGLNATILMPERFEQYLREVYFASFDPNTPGAVNRNTVSHGVAPEQLMDTKAATLSLLILEHILYLAV